MNPFGWCFRSRLLGRSLCIKAPWHEALYSERKGDNVPTWRRNGWRVWWRRMR